MTQIEHDEWLDQFIEMLARNPDLATEVWIILALRAVPIPVPAERNARILNKIFGEEKDLGVHPRE